MPVEFADSRFVENRDTLYRNSLKKFFRLIGTGLLPREGQADHVRALLNFHDKSSNRG